MKSSDVLDYKFQSSDLDTEVTIREYFQSLLLALWSEGEGFSGKRPFGNSGWEYDVYAALIRGGYIKGTLDEDGYVDELDTKKAHRFVTEQVILRLFEKPNA